MTILTPELRGGLAGSKGYILVCMHARLESLGVGSDRRGLSLACAAWISLESVLSFFDAIINRLSFHPRQSGTTSTQVWGPAKY